MARLEGTGFQELEEIIAYHQDVTAALTLYFSDWETIASARYAGLTESEVGAIGQVRFEETNSRSILQLLSSIEAALRLDYLARCERKAKDPLSRAFRAYRQEVQRARLDALLGLWAHHHPELKKHCFATPTRLAPSRLACTWSFLAAQGSVQLLGN